MKRIAFGLLAAFIALAGLVSVSSSPASAACPYTNCVATQVSTAGPRVLNGDDRATIQVGVRAAGNVRPTGTVRFTIYRKGKKGAVHQVTKNLTPGGDASVSRTMFTTPKLGKGNYTLVFRYNPNPTSVFKASKTSRGLRVQ